MKKILSLILGLLWALPVWGVDYSNCQNLFDGEYISVSGGHKAENANDFYVSPGERYVALWTTYTPAAMNLYGYDTQGNTVGSWSSGAYAPNGVTTPFSDNYMAWQKGAVFTVPDGVAYLRFNTFGNLSASQQQAWAESFKIYNMDCVDKIKIATTKYNETAFSPLNTALANAISVVDTVVSNTITQAGRIATLQAQKQTRPNDIADDSEKCPAGKKCLLVEDASGVPHWYEIVTSRLPDGYTELEYIESTGTQYIDTGIVPTKNTKLEIRNVQLNNDTAFGVVDKIYVFNIGNTCYYSFGGSHNSGGTQSLNLINLDATIIMSKDDGLIINGNTFQTFTDVLDFDTTVTFTLFARNSENGLTKQGSHRTYYLKMYDNNTLIQHLVPAKNPDGKIGMYDLVGGRFYENAGTGEFVAGNPVVE